MTTVRRRALHRIAIVAMALTLTPALAGCWQGFGASTTMQNSMNTGNGTQVKVGSIRVENATIVRGDDGRASLIMSVFNDSAADEALVGVLVNGQQVEITDAAGTPLPPGNYRSFGYGTQGQPADAYLLTTLDIEPGSYTSVALAFGVAGVVEFESLVVPPVGYYEGLLPEAS